MKHARQGGFALPILLILLTGVTIFVANRTLQTFGGLDLRASLRTDIALRTARDALIAYSAVEDNSPGGLLCPDLDGDGVSDSCGGGGTPSLGLVPWRTLGIPPQADASGACIWYALSPGARSSGIQTSARGRTQPQLNPGYSGELVLGSSDSEDKTVIALLIAPGRPIAGQTRPSTGQTCNSGPRSDFLEGTTNKEGEFVNNAGGGANFITAPIAPAFNDRVLAIASDQLFNAVAPKVLATWAGRGAPPQAGIRQLLDRGVTFNDGSFETFKFVDCDEAKLNCAPSSDAVSAFGEGLGLAVESRAEKECLDATAPGKYAIEWLCYNGWKHWLRLQTKNDAAGHNYRELSLLTWRVALSPDIPPVPSRKP